MRPLLVLAFILLPGAAQAADSFGFPSEEDVAGIQKLCGAGRMDSLQVKGDLDAAIKSWKSASANAGLEGSKINIAAAIGRVKDEQHLEGVYKIYADCVSDQVQKFLDRSAKQPQSTPNQAPAPAGFVTANNVEFLFNQCDKYQPAQPANYLPHSCCRADGTRVATGLRNPDPEYHGNSAVPIGAKCVAMDSRSRTYVRCTACSD